MLIHTMMKLMVFRLQRILNFHVFKIMSKISAFKYLAKLSDETSDVFRGFPEKQECTRMHACKLQEGRV